MLALSTDSLKGYGLDRIFRFASKIGYDGIDLAIDTKTYDTFNEEYLKEISDRYKIPITSIQAPKSSGPKSIQKCVDLAKILDCRIIIVQPPKIFNLKYASWLKNEVPKIRKKEELSIALENASHKTFLGLIPEYAMNNLNELRKFKHACLDTSRIAEQKEDLIRTYNLLKNFLVHIHLSNMYRSKSYYIPMQGVLPLESFLAKLKQDNFKGAISIKVNPKYLDAENEDKMLKNLEEIKEFCEKYFK